MSYRKPLVGLSLFLVLGLVVSWLVFVTLRREVYGPTNTYSAMFTDVSGMHAGDDVRVAGVRVGRVDKVELVGTEAKVTFRVQRDTPIYTDTVVSVTYQNIIGQRYLGLSQGQVGQRVSLPAGSVIPLARTKPSFDISNLLNGFEPLLTVLDPKQVDNITNTIVAAFQGDTGSVLALITQTSALAQSLEGPDDVLGETIGKVNDAVTNLAQQSDGLQQLIRQVADILRNLDSRRDALVEWVGSINATVARLATIVSTVEPDLKEFFSRQPGVLGHMRQNQDKFGFFIDNVPSLTQAFARIVGDGAYTNAYVCNVNIDIFAFLARVVPAIVRLASPGDVVQNSAVCR